MRDADPERALIIAVLDQGDDGRSELDEMHELLRTAGCVTVGEITQHRTQPDQRTYLGAGKLDEVAAAIAATNAVAVVCDDELTPTQQRALENRLDIRIVDRTAVILDIFASHAHTAEGKLQVELAQLEYNLQRMRGMWKHLSEQYRAGVGMRGPGETQLETDRRLARTRIALLRRRLRELRRQRGLMRRRRTRNEVPSVALAGYTNVGKSTLLNALTGAEVSTANRLFETLDPTTRAYDHRGRTYTVTDTVGFIRKLPHGLVEAFASTLEETLQGDLLLLVADASAPEEERAAQQRAVEEVLTQIGADDLPRLLVLNKADLVPPEERRRLHNAHADAVLVSARTGEGLDALEDRIAAFFAERYQPVELLVPHDAGRVIAELYALGAPIEEREDTAVGVRIRAHLSEAEARRYDPYRVNGSSPA